MFVVSLVQVLVQVLMLVLVPVPVLMMTWDGPPQTTVEGDSSVLSLLPANTSTAGEFLCLANNNVPKEKPKEDRMSRFVKVNHAPIIDEVASKVKVACDKQEAAEGCELVCVAVGWPLVTTTWLRFAGMCLFLTLSWSRSGQLITKEDKGFELVTTDKEDDSDPLTWTSRLTVKKVSSEEFGNYTCKAANVYGEGEVVVSLEVSGPPDPPTQFTAKAATPTSITLRWARLVHQYTISPFHQLGP